MALLCISYFMAVSACLTVAGLLIEQSLAPAASRRWLWALIIVISAFMPPFLAAWHSSSVVAIWGYELFSLPAHPHTSETSVSHNLLDCNTIYGSYFNWSWVIALVVLLVWGIANARRVSRLSRPGGLSRNTIVDGVNVVLTESVGPATVGLWRSRVVLPRWVLALPNAERRYVVRHEEEHRTARDTWLLGAMAVVVSLAPWNLPLWYQLNRLRLAVELDCDNRVVSALGDPGAYSELLFKVAEAASRGPRLQPAFLGASGSLEKRLVALLTPSRTRWIQRFGSVVLAAFLITMILSVPHPQRDVSAHVAKPAGGHQLAGAND
jgi:beta-lactamase regulating signal transducer with metallopeptidase domain